MDRNDIQKVKEMKLPTRKISQEVQSFRKPPLVRSNTVLTGNSRGNKAEKKTLYISLMDFLVLENDKA